MRPLRLPRGLEPLRHRDFAIYWTGWVVSLTGSWIEITATSYLLYELTRSPVLLGLLGLFRAIPLIALSLVGGTLADRLPRKRVVTIAQTLLLATSLLLGTLVSTGAIQFWHIYAISVLNAVLTAFETPARQAMFPTLVPRQQMQNAITLNTSVFRFSTLLGPAIAGWLIANVSLASPFFVNAVSYLGIITALAFVRVPHLARLGRATFRSEFAGGIRYVLASPILPLVFLVEGALGLFGHNAALITIFAREVLHVGAQGLGLLLSAIGAGALLGMLVLVTVGDLERKGRVMLAAGALYAAALLIFARTTSFPVAVLVLGLLGFADAIWGAMRQTIVQLTSADAYRGRVMSISIVVSRGLTQLSQVQTGAVVAALGPAFAATTGAVLVAATIAAAAFRSPLLRDFSSRRDALPAGPSRPGADAAP